MKQLSMTTRVMVSTRPVVIAVVAGFAMATSLLPAATAQARPIKLEAAGSIDNGFNLPSGVAIAPDGNLYVADTNNRRVQELTPTGEFVLMFGWDVNETKTNEGAPQVERNVCAAESEDKCQSGVEGTGAEQFQIPSAIAVDPVSGEVYVGEASKQVSKYTAGGEFIWRLGKKVDQTTGDNLCTAASKDVCGAGELSESGEPGAFWFTEFGQVLAVGGPDDRLYVGDAGRVQEFNAEGEWQHELALGAISAEPESMVGAIAVDAAGDIYLTYGSRQAYFGVYEFDASDAQVNFIELAPHTPGWYLFLAGLALDDEGHLVVTTYEKNEELGSSGRESGGRIFDATTGRLESEFESPEPLEGPSFELAGSPSEPESRYGYLYGATKDEILLFKPVSSAELVTTGASCQPGASRESNVEIECQLNGEVNPDGVPDTEVWFQWGLTEPLGEVAPLVGGELQPVAIATGEEPVPVSATITSARPNEPAVRYRLAGYDESAQPPAAPLASEPASFATPFVAPAIVGEPGAQSVGVSTAVLVAELNPENASTSYRFQYAPAAPCEALEAQRGSAVDLGECPEEASTEATQSSAYGEIGATGQLTGLQPASDYRFRLVAVAHSEVSGELETLEARGPVATLTTARAPAPSVATGAATAVGVSTAQIAGTVDPDGEPAAYIFELGVDEGGRTQYDIVASGAAGAGSVPIEEMQALTGLQPGTTYAYRIAVKSGYTPEGEEVVGETKTFTTGGLPAVLPGPDVLPLLAVPNVSFPQQAHSHPHGKPQGRSQKLRAALKACKRRPKRRRARCERSAKRRFGANDRKSK